MQHTFVIVCLIVAAASFGLAALGVASRVNLVAFGLLAFALSVLVPLL